MKKNNPSESGFNEILLYTTPNGNVKVEIYLQDETIWLTQQKIADLFGVDRTVVTKHIGNIFKSGELDEQLVCANFAHTTAHGAIKGKTQEKITRFYNLDVIISVGYRVNSSQATAFRIWATERLKEYIIKGFTMDDERLKNPNNIFGKDYFDNMGLTNWKNAPKGSIRKTDVGIAKNDLNEKELKGLNRIVTMYLDYSENQADKGIVMYMKDWIMKLDSFLQFNEESILQHQGKVTHEVALSLAENEFEKYRIAKDKLIESDFDKAVKKFNKK